jgi:hypothetical protein
MNPRLILPTAFVLLSACGAARAEIIEIPLPDVTGLYVYQQTRGASNRRTVSFDLGGNVAQVNGAWIRWSGRVVAGWGSCSGGGLFEWGGGIQAHLDQYRFESWRALESAAYPDWENTFDETLAFTSPIDPGWDFLSDGTGDVIVSIWAVIYVCGEMRVPPTATLDSATLVLDVVMAPVPVEPTTWGRIKALYRP